MPSLSFNGDETSYLRIQNTSDLNFGTGDFTIEWYQYQTDSNDFPRIFQIGSLDPGTTSIGVSIEVSGDQGTFYYWTNNEFTDLASFDSSEYKDQWVHFAICRSNGTTQVFMNGTSFHSEDFSNDNFNSVQDLVIANESIPANNTAFGGYLTYFSWIKGTARYTSDFTVSNTYPPDTGVLLLKADSFEGTLGGAVGNNNVGTTPNVPPGFSSTPPPPVVRNWRSLSSLFSNNAAVYYKHGSLASGGVGSVRNSSAKARKT
jgi:hypothetical protein